MTTALSIIEAGYARSTANDAGVLAVDAELLAHLNRKYQSMHARLALAQRANALASVPTTFAGIPAAAPLPTDVIDIVRIETETGDPVYLIDVASLNHSYHLPPCVYRMGNALVSRGQSGDPAIGNVYTLFHTDAPASITALTSTLDPRFPARYEMVLVLDIAVYLSLKDTGRDPEVYKSLKLEYAEENATFLSLTKTANTAKDSPVAAGATPGATGGSTA